MTGTNFPAEPSDDPTTAAAHDPTVTGVTASFAGAATKTAILFNDIDGDGVPGPGDTLLYLFGFMNTGNAATPNGLDAVDVPDPNTTLVVGSVVVSQGVITSGNNPGDTHVEVTLGPIQGRGGTLHRQLPGDDQRPAAGGSHPRIESGRRCCSRLALRGDRRSEHLGPGRSDRDPGDRRAGRGRHQDRQPVHRCRRQRLPQRRRHAALHDRLQQHRQHRHSTASLPWTRPTPTPCWWSGRCRLNLGTITSGNNPGDTMVAADIGTIPVGVQVRPASW